MLAAAPKAALERYRSARILVLALWQPHATLCVAPDPENGWLPAKRHETRSWFPFEKVPFVVAVHATKRMDVHNRTALEVPRIRAALKRAGFYPGDPRELAKRGFKDINGLKAFPLGAILGLATVESIWSLGTPPQRALDVGVNILYRHELTDDDFAMGNFLGDPEASNPHRYAWRLRDAVQFPEPVPHSGRQEALYDLDLETRERIDRELLTLEQRAINAAIAGVGQGTVP